MTADGLLDFANRLEKIEEEFKKKLKMQENAHHEEYKKLSDTFDTELKGIQDAENEARSQTGMDNFFT